jgi:trimethylamine--corrinoid protein Co-methyltransferase
LRGTARAALAEPAARVTRFLAERGLVVQHAEALRDLARAGALVDPDARVVRFPEALQQAALATVPRTMVLAATDRGADVRLPHPAGSFYLCTGTGARGIVDPETGEYRLMRAADAQRWGHLVSHLEHVDLCAFPTPTDVPPETADVHSLRAVLGSCTKHVWIQPHTEASLPFLLELVAVRAGGRESLARRPIASIIATALTPFVLKHMDVEVMLQAGRLGLPVHVSSLPVLGGTSPITPAGAVLVAGIEVLAMTVIAQLLRPGAPVVALATALGMDMASGRAVKCSPEAMLVNAFAARMLGESFGLPTHTAGLSSDAMLPDGQAMVEHSMYALMVADAGADILGRAGELEAAKTFSPVQLIVDDEIVAAVKRLQAGVDMDEEALDWEEIWNASPGGHFLEGAHALRHCREQYRPVLFARQARNQWLDAGGSDLLARARVRYGELMGDAAAELPAAGLEEMDRLVRKADRELAGGSS